VLSFRIKPILAALILPVVLLTISFSDAQTPDANQEQRLLALVKEVQAQQAQMAENQAKIDEKINELEETIRDARIYSKRSK
jgi:membrane glycosyltransferase